MKKWFLHWALGGYDLDFFKRHDQALFEYNRHILGLLTTIMSVASLLFFAFNLNSWEFPAMRRVYGIFFLIFLALHIFHNTLGKRMLKNSVLPIAIVMELIFLFLLLVEPILDYENLASFIPVFFVVIPVLTITPMYFDGTIIVLDMLIFAAVSMVCKGPRLATVDIVNGVTCVVIGLVLGRQILKGRLHEIEAYELLKKQSEDELSKALELANRDALTGVKSRAAYESAEALLNEQIHSGILSAFALVFCDVNDLKSTNDTLGHEAGDRLIQDCTRIICTVFAHSPVFRIGGDEFIVLLKNQDYADRAALMEQLRKEAGDPPILASGISEFRPGEDTKVHDVFIRADDGMYDYKRPRRDAVHA